MKKTLSEQIAVYGMLLILTPMIIFHILVISGIIPHEIVWGGRLSSQSEMLLFETISIIALSLMVFVIAVYAGLLKVNMHRAVMRVSLGLMTGLFFVNTAGNMQSLNQYEKLVFTPVTFLLFLFSFRLYLIHRSSKSN
jgi:hypothetical protein